MLALLIAGLIPLLIGSCTLIKKKMDHSGINDIEQAMLTDFKSEDPDSLVEYIDRFKLQEEHAIENLETVKTQQLHSWLLDDDIVHEKITFPSKLKKSNGQNDTAVFYLYREGKLDNEKVILWIPGFGVSDFAFRFIRQFFEQELDAGYAVLFYNIPFHLERIEPHRERGEGFATGSIVNNLEVIKHSLYEIRTVVAYMRSRGASSIGGWGGSIGGALLWLSSASIEYEHITLMIPIVDWNTVIFNPRMAEVIDRMNNVGLSRELIRSAYKMINPFNIRSKTNSARVQILYAKHDQLTPESKILQFADKWKIRNVIGYEESHASILINNSMYDDNRRFLNTLAN